MNNLSFDEAKSNGDNSNSIYEDTGRTLGIK